MSNNDVELTRLQEKFRKSYAKVENKRSDYIAPTDYARRGGFFSTKRRKQLLGLMGKYGGRSGENTMTYFWNEVNNTVETALIDLQLFLDTADEKNINKVITPEALEPIVESLLYRPILQKAEPDLTRVNIAKLFIHMGFEYLSRMQNIQTREFLDDTVKNAYVTSKHLAELLYAKVGSNQSKYITPIERWERPRD